MKQPSELSKRVAVIFTTPRYYYTFKHILINRKQKRGSCQADLDFRADIQILEVLLNVQIKRWLPNDRMCLVNLNYERKA
jgi:hypothetical protein